MDIKTDSHFDAIPKIFFIRFNFTAYILPTHLFSFMPVLLINQFFKHPKIERQRTNMDPKIPPSYFTFEFNLILKAF